MAGGYLIDPETGKAGVRTASGGFLPLPMSPDQLSAAGIPGPPGVPPPPPQAGPDERQAALSAAEVAAAARPKLLRESDAITRDAKGIPRIHLGDPNAAPVWDTGPAPLNQQPEMRLPTKAEVQQDALRAVQRSATVDPSELARPRTVQQSAQGSNVSDPSQEAAIAAATEYLKGGGGGGGGPRGLGISGETRKFQTFQNPGGDPEKVAAAQDALGASDKYGEELAKSLTLRQQQAYEAQQAEFAARSGQLAAQQQRFEHQQAMLQDYQAKRDAMVQEAQQLKTPQMEDYWKSRGTFANVMTGISIALGGALQGLNGGQNPGLEMANQSIDRWISAQREEYQRAQGRITDADNQFARMVQQFGSENLAASHLREQAWNVRDGMLKSYAEKIGTPTALENYTQAMLQTEVERARLAERNSKGAEVEIEQKLSMQGGGGGKPRTLAEAYKIAAETKKNADIVNGKDTKGDNGPKPSDLKELNQSDAALAGVEQVLNGVAPGEELPGIKGHNLASQVFRGVTDTFGGPGTGSSILDTEEERGNLQRVEWMQKQIIHSLTGAGMSNEERADYEQMIRGARTTQDLRNIVQTIKQQNAEQRRLINGGAPANSGNPTASTFRPMQ